MPGKGKVELKPVDALGPAAVELRSENLLAMGSVTFHLSDNYLSLHRHVRCYFKLNTLHLQLYEEQQRRKAMFYLSGETAMALSIVEQKAKVQPGANKS